MKSTQQITRPRHLKHVWLDLNSDALFADTIHVQVEVLRALTLIHIPCNNFLKYWELNYTYEASTLPTSPRLVRILRVTINQITERESIASHQKYPFRIAISTYSNKITHNHPQQSRGSAPVQPITQFSPTPTNFYLVSPTLRTTCHPHLKHFRLASILHARFADTPHLQDEVIHAEN